MTSFNITATPQSEAATGSDGIRRVVFSVGNETGRAIMARAELKPSDPACEGWLSIDGEKERTFGFPGTQTFKVVVKPPEDAATGRYTFQLHVAVTNEPSVDLEAWSEPIAFEIAERLGTRPVVIDKVTPPPTNGWRIVAIGLGALALVALLAIGVLIVFGSDDDVSPEPSLTPGPTRTSEPTPTSEPTRTSEPTPAPEPTLAAPTGLMLDGDCDAGFTLVWQPVSGATGYRIYRDGDYVTTVPQPSFGFPPPRDSWHSFTVIATAEGMPDSVRSKPRIVEACLLTDPGA